VARYRIIPERSPLSAEAKSSLHPIRVEAVGFEGYLDLEVTDGRLNLDVPVSGHIEFPVEMLKTGNGLYDRELERRLEARRYPRIRGEVREVRALDTPGRYAIRGELSFHGMTKPVERNVAIRTVADHAIEIDGEIQLDMRDYALEPPKLLMLRVYPEVHVRGRVVAEREH
jgi:polyisoprenoid-binding protein YceI